MLLDTSKQAAEEIIIRLNGIRESNYSSKIAYDVFKSLGRIYERRYQKDVQESLSVLEPIMEVIDSVFVELYRKQNSMIKPIQNSFMMAYTESSFLDSLKNLKDPRLEKALEVFTKFDHKQFHSLPNLLLKTSEEIREKNLFNISSESFSDVLYSLTSAKRKIERELDWTLCSFEKEIFPLIRNSNLQKFHSQNGHSDSFTLSVFNPDVIELSDKIDKKLKEYVNNEKWIRSQNLSLLLKSSSKNDDTFYLDTKDIPDANDLTKVIAIPKIFESQKITAKKLAKIMNVRPRMAQYYLDAAEMLGLLEKINDYYKPTELVNKLEKYSEQDRNGIIQHLIEQLPVVKAFLQYMKTNSKTNFTTHDIAKFLEYSTNLSSSTAKRRASTIASWLKMQKIVRYRNDSYHFDDDSSQTKLVDFMKKHV